MRVIRFGLKEIHGTSWYTGDMRKIFVAGSTGATGRTLMRVAQARGVRGELVAHVRPRSASAAGDGTVVFDLADAAALTNALRGCTTVVQLIGTMRKRFAAGDTYESSDIGTTQSLVDAARAAGTVDHVVLLSSVGAGRPMGAYLHAKARAEAIVTGSGLPYTIFRPSAFYGEGHKGVPGGKAVTRLLGLKKYEPIAVEELAAAILQTALLRSPLGVALEGQALWDVVAAAKR